MVIQIVSVEGTLAVETVAAADAGERPFPCHRCGVCCERWQPLVGPEESARLAMFLDITDASFHDHYTTSYPFSDDLRLLRQEEGRCVFLTYERDSENSALSRALCTVHAARPTACREWIAGFDKRECLEGLARFATAGGLVQLGDLYPDPADQTAFLAVRPLL